MSKIDTVKWKEFEVGELFDGENGDFDIKSKHINGKGHLVITSGTENSGILGRTDISSKIITENTITVDMFGNTFFRPYKYKLVTHARVFALIPKFEMTQEVGLFISTILFFLREKFSYSHMCSYRKIKHIKIKLPTNNNQPDWEYMENYITEIENKYINTLEQHNNEKIEQALKVTGLSKEDLNEDLKVEPAKRYEKFRVGDLFDKKTIKGVPKSKEKLQENKTGYHVFGQNIKYQYPQKVLLEEQYLQTIQTPILAYSSSTAQIGYIKENFYRTGDNGAFQGLFPKKTNVAIHSLLYILVVLKKQFDWFGYATEMGNILNLEITLPATNENTPDFEYMKKAIYIYFRQVIQNWKLSNEKEIEELKQVINK